MEVEDKVLVDQRVQELQQIAGNMSMKIVNVFLLLPIIIILQVIFVAQRNSMEVGEPANVKSIQKTSGLSKSKLELLVWQNH
jgi:hypothetical protein